ncbi:hypothetical protein, partial [Pseudosulfitobacter sp. DSM 107133]
MIHPELVAAALIAAGHFGRGASERPLDAETFWSCSLKEDPIAASERAFVGLPEFLRLWSICFQYLACV